MSLFSLLAMTLDTEQFEALSVFGFLSIGAICIFGIFLPLASWFAHKRKEREAFYKAETMRRITESSSDGAQTAIEYLREEDLRRAWHEREGIKMTGLILICVGAGICLFMWRLMGNGHGPWLAGAVPGMIGVAQIVYVYLLAEPLPPLKSREEQK